MRVLKQVLLLLAIFFFYSCHHSGKYPYAIKDFPEKLQPYLVGLVEKGLVEGGDTSLRDHATDADLERLGNAEHPLLRVAAFREMLERKSLNHFDLLMKHLDDTAVVFFNKGEFGIDQSAISDQILFQAIWKTQAEKDKTVDEVLTKHNYLGAAYYLLWSLEPREKYYSIIRKMASQQRQIPAYGGDKLAFYQTEHALYGLAKFRKKEDIQLIKERMMERIWHLSHVSFQLMREFRDTAYLEVLEAYHKKGFYNFSNHMGYRFECSDDFRADPKEFIKTLVVQQEERSAILLDTMLASIPRFTCWPDKDYLLDELIEAIWDHPCPAYARLRGKIRVRAEAIQKMKEGPQFPCPPRVDTTPIEIRWISY